MLAEAHEMLPAGEHVGDVGGGASIDEARDEVVSGLYVRAVDAHDDEVCVLSWLECSVGLAEAKCFSAVTRGEPERAKGGERRFAGPDLREESCMTKFDERVHVVVAGRAVCTERERYAEGIEGCDARDPRAELQVGARAVDDPRLVAREHASLLVGELDAVRQNGLLPPETPATQDVDIVRAENLSYGIALARVFGDVAVHERPFAASIADA